MKLIPNTNTKLQVNQSSIRTDLLMDTINLAGDDYRNNLIALAISMNPTHWVTLNLHRDSTLDNAARYLRRWRVEILRRLYGRRFFDLPESELIEFVGCPERSIAGHPHFHLVCRVPAAASAKFERIATERWKAIVPSGTSHIELIDERAGSPHRVMSYATKHLDVNSTLPFIHSHQLH